MHKFLILTGPSAVGKSTIIKQILRDERFHLSVSYTTRIRRPHEVAGEDYYFVSKENFENMLSMDLFLEHTVFGGNYYGTPAHPDLKDKIIIFDIDIRGYYFFKEHYPGSYFCLLTAEREVVETRLMKRIQSQNQRTSEKEIEQRLKSFGMFTEINDLDHFNCILDNSGAIEKIFSEVDYLVKNAVEHLNGKV